MDAPAFCPECGAPDVEDDPFCANCGGPLRPASRPLSLKRAVPEASRRLFIIAAVLGVVSVLLLGLAFVSDWYEFEMESNTDKVVLFEDLGGYEVQNSTDTQTGDWDGTLPVGRLYGEIRPFLLTSLSVGVLGTILSAFVPYTAFPRKAGYAALVLLIVTGTLVLGSAVHFMMEHPEAYAEDETFGELRQNEGPWKSFSGSNGTDTPRSSWGPRTGWSAAIFSGVLSLGSAFLCIVALYVSTRTADRDDPRIPGRVLRRALEDEPLEEDVQMPEPEVPDKGPARYGRAKGAPPGDWSPPPIGQRRGEEGGFEEHPVYGSGRRETPRGRRGTGYDDGLHPDVYREPFDDRIDGQGPGADAPFLPPVDDRYEGTEAPALGEGVAPEENTDMPSSHEAKRLSSEGDHDDRS